MLNFVIWILSFGFSRKGAVTLPIVLIISAIIMQVTVAAVIISSSFGGTAFNARISTEAYAVASAGADDAILKIIRYCPIGAVAGSQCPSNYSLIVNNRTADILIKDDLSNPGNKIVISTASILGRIKRVEAVLFNDQVTGRTEVKSFRECYNYDNAQQICL